MKVECVGEEESDKIGKAGPAKVPATNGEGQGVYMKIKKKFENFWNRRGA